MYDMGSTLAQQTNVEKEKKSVGGELGGTMELRIAAGEALRGKDEWPVSNRNCRLTVGFCGSVEVNDSAGVFQLSNNEELVPAECV
jgi:hypothetical protein